MHRNVTHVSRAQHCLVSVEISLVMREIVRDVYSVPLATLLFPLWEIWSYTVNWPSTKRLYCITTSI